MAKILVIDDDKDILRLLEFTLKRVGHEVITCADGLQGLAEVEAQHPDLIVADIMMPKMTGYEFCKHVRAQPSSAEIPIIIFSARFQPIDKQTALDAGATDYLSKSSSPEVLIKAITEHLPSASSTTTGTVIGFFSLRGGTGVTSLAVNTAVALAFIQKTKPALVDLTPLGGHAALMLGLRPTSSVVNALSARSDFILDSIKPHFIEHGSGIQLLPSTLDYEHQLATVDQRLKHLITALKSGFPFVIFDNPHILVPEFRPILQLFDKIALVLSPDMPSLQSTATALQALTWLGVPEIKIALVVNQVTPQGALPLEMIKKAVKRPLAAHIPFEPAMIKAINNGNPLLLDSPKSAGAAAIAQLATSLVR